MFSIKSNNRRSATVSACAAVLLAIASSSALAYGGGVDEEDDDAPSKTQACSWIGCANGNRVCGTASGKITSGAPPFVGEVAVSWTCYEVPPQ